MRKAIQLCPDIAIVPPRIDFYAKVSHEIRAIFSEFTPCIEPLSLDEAFLDVTKTVHLFGSPETIGRAIKERIRTQLGLVASVGIGPNKFIAKVASDLRKPDALVMVRAEEVHSFLDPLPIERVWGVGKVTSAAFRKLSIRTIGELRRLDMDALRMLFGNSADHYWSLSRGLDARKVTPDREAKSISSESTFAEDIDDREALASYLVHLVESASRRLRNHQLQGRGIELKVRYSDFQSITRSAMLPMATDVTSEFLEAATTLFSSKVPNDGRSVRLLGFGIHHFQQDELKQMSLFDEDIHQRDRKLDSVTDSIAEKFGRAAIRRGGKNA
jgi:DNA polymerase-4